MNHSRKKLLIAALAVTLVLLASTGVTLAYFSDYETGMGEVTIHLNGQTQIDEKVTDTEKVVKIVNTGDANMLVRVAIYGPDGMKVTADDSHWKKDGEYYYYTEILPPGQTTSSLTASVEDIPVTDNMPEFDIIVNHESAIVTYDKYNQVKKPDGWDGLPTIKVK